MTAATEAALQVKPLSGWTGALITGVDLTEPLSGEQKAAVRAALHQWKMTWGLSGVRWSAWDCLR
jgi:alpha-ketoglutarate-dependent sulfate ester dioxygenase